MVLDKKNYHQKNSNHSNGLFWTLVLVAKKNLYLYRAHLGTKYAQTAYTLLISMWLEYTPAHNGVLFSFNGMSKKGLFYIMYFLLYNTNLKSVFCGRTYK